MSDGFDYDPEAIREFAAVFEAASGQIGEVRTSVGETSAKAADFGRSWAERGANFEKYIGMLADDLDKLSQHLGEVAGQLNQGTDLMIEADTSGLRQIKAVDDTGEAE